MELDNKYSDIEDAVWRAMKDLCGSDPHNITTKLMVCHVNFRHVFDYAKDLHKRLNELEAEYPFVKFRLEASYMTGSRYTITVEIVYDRSEFSSDFIDREMEKLARLSGS